MRGSGHAFGPSESALAGSGWVSMNSPETPAATAARASTGTNSRWPPDDVPCPPGSCTECVASNTTDRPIAWDYGVNMAFATRADLDADGPHPDHQTVVALEREIADWAICDDEAPDA